VLAQLYKGDAELRRALNAEQLIVGECRICGWPLRPPDNPGELRSGGAGLE